MTSLIHCIYSSIATASFSEDELPGLLAEVRIANSARGITGMLIYANGNFLQVIEGESGAVDDLYQKIARDSRHKRIFMLVREPISCRTFGGWSMGFEALLPSDIGALAGENDFFDAANCLAALKPGAARTILSSFRQTQQKTP